MFYILLWIICGFIGGMIGDKKGEGCLGLLVGFLLGPLGIVIILVSSGNRRPCPHCKEPMHKNASVCPHCRTALRGESPGSLEKKPPEKDFLDDFELFDPLSPTWTVKGEESESNYPKHNVAKHDYGAYIVIGVMIIFIGVGIFILVSPKAPRSSTLMKSAVSKQVILEKYSKPIQTTYDLSNLRKHLLYMMKEDLDLLGRNYELYDLHINNRWLIVVLDMLFRPPSKRFLRDEAGRWALRVQYQKLNDRLIKDISDLDIRISILTSIDATHVAPWGDWRSIGGWTPGLMSKKYFDQ